MIAEIQIDLGGRMVLLGNTTMMSKQILTRQFFVCIIGVIQIYLIQIQVKIEAVPRSNHRSK